MVLIAAITYPKSYHPGGLDPLHACSNKNMGSCTVRQDDLRTADK
jgi:hypothetical protein